jgi:hypothetical protein
MYLPVLRPCFTQSLHTESRNDSQGGRLESWSAFVDSNVRRDAHLRDEVEILLVTRYMLVLHSIENEGLEGQQHTIHCRRRFA